MYISSITGENKACQSPGRWIGDWVPAHFWNKLHFTTAGSKPSIGFYGSRWVRLFFTVPRMGYGRPLSSTAAADVETLQVAGGWALERRWSFGVPWRLVLFFFWGGGLKISDLFKGFRMVFWILFLVAWISSRSCVFFFWEGWGLDVLVKYSFTLHWNEKAL